MIDASSIPWVQIWVCHICRQVIEGASISSLNKHRNIHRGSYVNKEEFISTVFSLATGKLVLAQILRVTIIHSFPVFSLHQLPICKFNRLFIVLILYPCVYTSRLFLMIHPKTVYSMRRFKPKIKSKFITLRISFNGNSCWARGWTCCHKLAG